MSIYHDIQSALIDIEAVLRQLDQWQSEPPSAEALASTEPFCVDTLQFYEWLQFVFIPRLQLLCEQEMPLPKACNVAPMAEEFYRGSGLPVAPLLTAIAQVDQLITQQGA